MSDAELSRAVSQALRHDPAGYGIVLDDHGWVELTELVAALRRRPRWAAVEVADVVRMVDTATKQRHELAGDRIRARYGHSATNPIRHAPDTPPEILYHGTSPEAADAILIEGILPQTRQMVHLAQDRPSAVEVAKRKTAHPVVLIINTATAQAAGVVFHRGNDHTWLAQAIHPNHIEVEKAEQTHDRQEAT